MADMTVQDLATEIRIPVDDLVAKLKDAGISAENADSPISSDDKMALIRHLRGGRAPVGTKPADSRISVPSRKRSQLKVTGQRGAPVRTVNVEVRKRRTFVRKDSPEEIAKAEAIEAAAKQAEQDAANLAAEEAKNAEAAAKLAEETAAAEAAQAAQAAADALAAEQAAAAEEAEAAASEPKAEPEAETAPAATKEAAEDAKPAPKKAATPEKAAPPAAEAEPSRPKFQGVKDPGAAPKSTGRMVSAGSGIQTLKGKTSGDTGVDSARRRMQENLRRAAESAPELRKQAEEQRKREELHVAKGKTGRKRKAGAGGRGRSKVKFETEHGFEKPTAPVIREITIPEAVTVGELAQKMAMKAGDLIKQMMQMGEMATINQALDQETATILVEEMGHTAKLVSEGSIEESLIEAVVGSSADDVETQSRAPVVTIMGHVDHGKTSLLDYIRKSRVAAGEAGGITQHIGAYSVKTPNGQITFLDTPGHAAFTKMRARGAQTTDVVILVCSADDGVMPQTKEAIQHSLAAEVPIVVAVTKVDKPDADPDKVRNEMSAEQIVPEEWGGEVPFINVSSHTGEGIDDLLEAILLQAEVLELRAPVDAPAKGVVIESSLEKGRGSVATVLVQEGTLSKGDVILAGRYFGRVRALFDESGAQTPSAGPSIPVEVLGLGGTPEAGDEVVVVANEKKAKELAELREGKTREKRQMDQAKQRRDAMMAQLTETDSKSLAVFIKADVQGSAEALADSIRALPTEELRIKIITAAVGGISESDIDLAAASNAMVIGFNVRADGKARKSAAEQGIDIRYYSVIYDVIDDIKDAVGGLLGTETKEKIVGTAEVRDVFSASKWGQVAGCLVIEGQVKRGLPIRVLRDNVVVYEGELESLRRHKDDVNTVDAGTECGIAVKNYNDVRKGDNIEVFERFEVARKVSEAA